MQVIETRKRVLGAEHPDTLTSINNLVYTFYGQGCTKQATQLIEHIIKSFIVIIRANYPNILVALRSLKV